METNNQVVSKERVANHGEVYTSEREVQAMLDLVKHETERIESRFLEPACGTGNFLIAILKRKLAIVEKRYKKSKFDFERFSILAISSIYGIDILNDNVKACRKRLFTCFEQCYTKLFKNAIDENCLNSAKYIFEKNIICGDALTLKRVDEDENIVFSEWSLVKDVMIKRRDFTYTELLDKEQAKDSCTLFEQQYDSDPAFLPKPIRDYPLTHFLRIHYES